MSREWKTWLIFEIILLSGFVENFECLDLVRHSRRACFWVGCCFFRYGLDTILSMTPIGGKLEVGGLKAKCNRLWFQSQLKRIHLFMWLAHNRLKQNQSNSYIFYPNFQIMVKLRLSFLLDYCSTFKNKLLQKIVSILKFHLFRLLCQGNELIADIFHVFIPGSIKFCTTYSSIPAQSSW